MTNETVEIDEIGDVAYITINIPIRIKDDARQPRETYELAVKQLMWNNTASICEHLELLSVLASDQLIQPPHFQQMVGTLSALSGGMVEVTEAIDGRARRRFAEAA